MIRINMGKPKDCTECPICSGDDECLLSPKNYRTWEAQYADCQLQEDTAHWIQYEDGSGIYCSKCETMVYYDENIAPGEAFNYCPECGAQMNKRVWEVV